MKKYVVIALSCGAINNKIFYSGEAVTADAFPEGHAEQLVANGHLREFIEGEDSLKHIVTEEDLVNQPELADLGVVVGDVVEMDPQYTKTTVNGVEIPLTGVPLTPELTDAEKAAAVTGAFATLGGDTAPPPVPTAPAADTTPAAAPAETSKAKGRKA